MIEASFNEFKKMQLEDYITDFSNDGKCSCCGNCCSNVLPLSNKEIKTIKKYIKKKKIKPVEHDLLVKTKLSFDMICPFRDEKNKICTIYEIRPLICKMFICNKGENSKKSRKILAKKNYKTIFVRETFF